jgi:hypothetical protein
MPSAVIAGYSYDASTEILEVRYNSGKIYHYLNVPEKVYNAMRSTMYKGNFLNREIKGRYDYDDVTPNVG